jgi:hypothetical protein
MGFPTIHGIKLAENAYITNANFEQLASDPTPSSAGRIWFNTTSKTFNVSVLDEVDAVVIRSFHTLEEFNAFVSELSSTDAGKGLANIGYSGQTGVNGLFSIAAGDSETSLDSIVVAIDATKKELADLGTGSLTDIQNEIDGIETAIGSSVDENGDYVAHSGTTYLDGNTTITQDIVDLDSAVNGIQVEVDAVETSIGSMISETGTFSGLSGTNYLDASTDVTNVVTILDSQIKTNADAIDTKLALAGGTMTGIISMSDNRITNLGAPVNENDAATKIYVDNAIQGMDWKESVRVASTENVDITTGGLLTIDGITLVAGDRVLLKDQTTATENGIYVVAEGAWVRSTDADNTPTGEVTSGMATFVSEGTISGGNSYVLTTPDDIVLGTTELGFTQFNGAGQIIAGTGLGKSGNEIFVNLGAGISETPTDEIGIDTYATGGLFTTVDGLVASTDTDAKLSIKLDGPTLTLSSSGIKVSDGVIAEINAIETSLGTQVDSYGNWEGFSGTNYLDVATSNTSALTLVDTQVKTVQDELDTTQTGAGLGADGTYVVNGSANYISTATSLSNADDLLDTQVKTVQDELDTTQTGAGLGVDGTYTANATANYISGATSLVNADDLLDTQVKAVQDELDITQTGAGLSATGAYVVNGSANYISAATSLSNADDLLDTQLKATQVEVDAVETSLGSMVDGNGSWVGFSGTNYLDATTSSTSAITTLDTQAKTNADAISTLKTDLNATVYTQNITVAATQHVITHNLGTDLIDIMVWVDDGTGVYKNDLVGITVDSENQVTIDLTVPRKVKVVVRSAITLS